MAADDPDDHEPPCAAEWLGVPALSQPELFELGALVSDPTAPRQPLHPDTPWGKRLSVVTVVVALCDVDLAMGPTLFLPRTHCVQALWGEVSAACV